MKKWNLTIRKFFNYALVVGFTLLAPQIVSANTQVILESAVNNLGNFGNNISQSIQTMLQTTKSVAGEISKNISDVKELAGDVVQTTSKTVKENSVKTSERATQVASAQSASVTSALNDGLEKVYGFAIDKTANVLIPFFVRTESIKTPSLTIQNFSTSTPKQKASVQVKKATPAKEEISSGETVRRAVVSATAPAVNIPRNSVNDILVQNILRRLTALESKNVVAGPINQYITNTYTGGTSYSVPADTTSYTNTIVNSVVNTAVTSLQEQISLISSSGNATNTFAFVLATSTTATSTFAGNINVNGNTEVGGNVRATAFFGDGSNLTGIVSGGAFSTSTTRNVFSAGDNLLYDATNGRFSLATSTIQGMIPASSISTSTVRTMFSLSAPGLTYDNSTGVTSLTSGYTIPLTASTTEWASKISSQWTTSGSDVYFNTGNVGVGVSSPSQKLDVGGNILVGSGAGSAYVYLRDAYNYIYNADGLPVDIRGHHGIRAYNDLGEVARFGISGGSLDSYFNGNVGIGVTSPNYALSLSSAGATIGIADQLAYDSPAGTLTITGGTGTAGGNAGGDLVLKGGNAYTGAGDRAGDIKLYAGGNNFSSGSTMGNIIFYKGEQNGGSTEVMRINSDGNVGIGTSSPSSKLSVVGDVNFTGALRFNGDAGTAGMVLLSNGSSSPTWVATSSLGITGGGGSSLSTSTIQSMFSNTATGLTYNSSTGATSLTSGYTIPLTASTTEWASKISSQWTTSGANISYTGGNVGVGTTSPSAKFSLLAGTNDSVIPAHFDTGVITDTTSRPFLITQRWNNSSLVGSAFKVDVTNTSSNANSLLADFQVNGSSVAQIRRTGPSIFTAPGAYGIGYAAFSVDTGGNNGFGASSANGIELWAAGGQTASVLRAGSLPNQVQIGRDSAFAWNGISTNSSNSTNNADLLLTRDAAATLQLGVDNASTTTNQRIKAHDVTTGTGASLTLAGGTGSVANGAIILQPTAGFVGIGTTTPGYALTVSGDSNITGALRFNGDAGTAGMVLLSNGSSSPTWVATSSLGITGGGGSSLSTSTIQSMFSNTATGLTYNSSTGATSLTSGYTIPLTASTTEWASKISSQWTTSGANISYTGGNVGVGTSTLSASLAVANSSDLPGLVLVSNSSQATNLQEWRKSDGTVYAAIAGGSAMTDNTKGVFTIYDRGIAKNSDGAILAVHADDFSPYLAKFYNDTYSASTPVFSYYAGNDGVFRQGTNSATPLHLFTDGIDNIRLTVAANGSIGISNQSPSASYKLDVLGKGRFSTGIEIGSVTSSAASPPGVYFGTYSTASGGTAQIVGNRQGSYYWGIGTNGATAPNNQIKIGGVSDTAGTWATDPSFALQVDGKLGVGTSSPVSAFAVIGTSTLNGVVQLPNIAQVRYGASNLILASSTNNTAFFAGAGSQSAVTGSGMSNNIGIGNSALSSLASGGVYNIALGTDALKVTSTGNQNVAVGTFALDSNTFGSDNTAIGYNTLSTISGTSIGNTALGSNVLTSLSSSANYNVAIGINAGTGMTGGAANIIIGAGSGGNGITPPLVSGSASNRLNIGGLIWGTSVNTTTGSGISSGNVGVGTSTPESRFTIAGASGSTADLFNIASSTNASLFKIASTGATYFNNDAGTAGMVLLSNGTGSSPTWVATSSLGITGGGGGGSGTVNSGTAGQVAFYSSTGTAVSGTSTLSFSGGNIGIGTTTPAYKLDVIGTSSAQAFRMPEFDSSGGGVLFVGANRFLYGNNGSENTFVGAGAGKLATPGVANTAVGQGAMINISSGGNYNLALGGTSARGLTTGDSNIAIGYQTMYDLSVGDNNIAIGRQAGYSITGSNNILIGYQAGKLNTGSTNIVIGHDINAPISAGSNQLVIGNLIYGTSIDGTGTTLSSGNIGIGTTTPWAKLTVAGEIAATHFTAASTTATSTFPGGLSVGGGALVHDWSSGLTTISNAALGAMTFDADSGMVSWIDMPVTAASASGTVQSYSAQLDGTPALTVYGLSDGAGAVNNIRLGVGTSTPTQALSVVGTINATNLLGGSTNLTVDANGNIIRDPSDENLKENIVTLEDSLSKIARLRGVRYEWKDKERFGTSTEIGVIAQEVEMVVPEVVSSGGLYKSVNIKNLVALLIEGVKELKTKVDGVTAWFGTSGDRFNVKGMVCVDDVCVSKEQFKQMLINSGSVMTAPQQVPAPAPTPESNTSSTTESTSGSTSGGESPAGENTSGGGASSNPDPENTPPVTPPETPPAPEPVPAPAPAPEPAPAPAPAE